MSTSHAGYTRRTWAHTVLWITLRTAQPCAVGALGALLVVVGVRGAWPLWATAGLAGCAVCAWSLYALESSVAQPLYPSTWLRQRAALLTAAALCASAARALQLRTVGHVGSPSLATVLLWVALVAGVASMALTAWGDRRRGRGLQRHYAIALLPWLDAARLGLLLAALVASWGRPVGATDQRVLSVVLISAMLDLVTWHRWQTSMVLGGGDARVLVPAVRERFALVVLLRSWMGCVLPAALIVATVSGESHALAAVAWFLLLAGDVMFYYLLHILRDQPLIRRNGPLGQGAVK